MKEVTLNNGEVVEIGINLGALFDIEEREDFKEYVETFYKKLNSEPIDTASSALKVASEVVYVGYLCGMLKNDKLDEAMNFRDFNYQLPENMMDVIMLMNELVNPTPSGSLAKPSARRQKK